MSGALRTSFRAFQARLIREHVKRSQTKRFSTGNRLGIAQQPLNEYQQHMLKEITMYKWVSYGFLFPFLALYSYYIATNHHDIKPLPDYPYFRINTKPFPWGDGRTPLFNHKIIKAGNQEHYGHLKTREEEEE